MNDANKLTATEGGHLMEKGRLHGLELMEACLARCADREPIIHAMAFLDPAQALDAARLARPGPLQGLPVGAKDVLDTADMPTCYNSAIWRGWRPKADAAAIAATRAAGGIIIGKTVTTEFAVRHPGPTTNPHNPAHTPGGSSSGSAAGVADFCFPLALGTQTAGSIIRPAAYCGIVGYKPSFGAVHRSGMKVMSESLDTIGFMARSVEDCALFASAIAAIETGDPGIRLERAPRVGMCRSPTWDAAGPETHVLFDYVADRIARAGAVIRAQELPANFDALGQAHPVVMNGESARALAWELAVARDQISAELRERLDFGASQDCATLNAARQVLAECRAAFQTLMDDLDILVTPAAPGEAPKGLDRTGDPVFNFIWTSLHVPCVTVPAGTGPLGLPLGIQIVAPFGRDREALACARWVASAVN